jgi:putative tryptophan/tyrosine transport system substrate-binding protein
MTVRCSALARQLLHRFGIDRRRFLVIALATVLAAPAQGRKDLPRIGWIGNMAPPPPPVNQLEGLQTGLRELGYVEGRNLLIEYRWAAGKLDRLPELVAELVGLRVDVLVVAGQQGLEAAKARAGATPVVLVACDPLEALLGSLARPGGTITGLTCVSSELAAKRLETLKDMIPRLARVAVLYNPSDPNKAIEVRQLDAAARLLAISLQVVAVGEPERFEAAFLTMTREHAQAFVTLADPFMNFHRRRIVELGLGTGSRRSMASESTWTAVGSCRTARVFRTPSVARRFTWTRSSRGLLTTFRCRNER